MKQAQILTVLESGGRIVNHMILNQSGKPYRCKITDRQIEALEAKGLVDKTVMYDRTRIWKLKAAPEGR